MAMFTGKSILPSIPFQKLPNPNVPEDVNLDKITASFEQKLPNLTTDDFTDDALWRDVFAYTGTFRTFYASRGLFSAWTKLSTENGIGDVRLDPGSAIVKRVAAISAWVQAQYTVKRTAEPRATCKVILSLVPDSHGKWRIWMLRTVLQQLEGHPSVDYLQPVHEGMQTNGHVNGQVNGHASKHKHFDCVMVGGGQFGLSMAGRLKALNISYVVLEKNKNVGDNWKSRYDSVKLHTTRDSSYLPFDRTFPSTEYGQFLTKDELAKGYAQWSDKYGINVWLETTLESGEWLSDEKIWKLHVEGAEHAGIITARHVVIATGAGGQIPKWPKYPGVEDFEGRIMHSAAFTSAKLWKGKDAVVVGSANTGHDIAEAMVAAGCSSVTMVQRSHTYVFATKYYEKALDMMYNDKIPTEVADLDYMTNPVAVNRLLSNYNLHAKAREDSDWYDALERTGFKLIRYGDILHQLYEHFGKHYMDVGSIDKIIKGDIKIKADALPVRYGPKSLIFDDGTEVPADVVVFATGFEGNTRDTVRAMFGDTVADQVEPFWGLDSEAEIRGAFKPSGHPNLWMMGGSCGQARYYSRFVAFHIRADIDGAPLKVHRG